MGDAGKAEGRATRPASPATSATTTQPSHLSVAGDTAVQRLLFERDPMQTARAADVDEMLATIRRFESTARVIADDENLTIKARCAALLDLMARARKRDGAAFLEAAFGAPSNTSSKATTRCRATSSMRTTG